MYEDKLHHTFFFSASLLISEEFKRCRAPPLVKAIRTPPIFMVIGYIAFAMSCELGLNEIDRVISQ
jgi:hypothetical protein